MTVSIRAARAADLDAIGALHHRSRRVAYAGIVPDEALVATPARAMAAWWTERWAYERRTHRLRVALTARDVVGFSYLGPSETAGAVELYAIHVDPGHQGTGVGRALMIEALSILDGYGTALAVLWVVTGNAHARRFYELGGWRPDGATRVAPIGAAAVPQLRYSHWLR